jgi:hypothetical protein
MTGAEITERLLDTGCNSLGKSEGKMRVPYLILKFDERLLWCSKDYREITV